MATNVTYIDETADSSETSGEDATSETSGEDAMSETSDAGASDTAHYSTEIPHGHEVKHKGTCRSKKRLSKSTDLSVGETSQSESVSNVENVREMNNSDQT